VGRSRYIFRCRTNSPAPAPPVRAHFQLFPSPPKTRAGVEVFRLTENGCEEYVYCTAPAKKGGTYTRYHRHDKLARKARSVCATKSQTATPVLRKFPQIYDDRRGANRRRRRRRRRRRSRRRRRRRERRTKTIAVSARLFEIVDSNLLGERAVPTVCVRIYIYRYLVYMLSESTEKVEGLTERLCGARRKAYKAQTPFWWLNSFPTIK